MDISYPTIEEPATPEDLLAIFADDYRHREEAGAVPVFDLEISFATRLGDFFDTIDSWWDIAQGLNREFKLSHTKAQWRHVFYPLHEHTLGELCRFIAPNVKVQRIRPALLLGVPSVGAGVFLTLRALLHEAGADVHDLTPSTPLEAYSRRYLHVFVYQFSRLVPLALPPVRVIHSRHTRVAGLLLFFGSLFFVIGICFKIDWLLRVASLVSLENLVVLYLAQRYQTRVEIGDLHTFRDLARAIEVQVSR